MTRLLIVRHGIAEETSRSGSDFDRALTPEGRSRVSKVGRELGKLDLFPDAIVSSPLLRAVETKELLRREFSLDEDGGVFEEFAPEAEPEAMFAALRVILGGRSIACLAVVGHLPSAPRFVAAALGSTRDCIEMKKAGVAVLDFPGVPAAGRGSLELLLAPKVFV